MFGIGPRQLVIKTVTIGNDRKYRRTGRGLIHRNTAVLMGNIDDRIRQTGFVIRPVTDHTVTIFLPVDQTGIGKQSIICRSDGIKLQRGFILAVDDIRFIDPWHVFSNMQGNAPVIRLRIQEHGRGFIRSTYQKTVARFIVV